MNDEVSRRHILATEGVFHDMVRPILSKAAPFLFAGLMVGFLTLGVLSSASTPLAAGAAAPSQYVTPPPASSPKFTF